METSGEGAAAVTLADMEREERDMSKEKHEIQNEPSNIKLLSGVTNVQVMFHSNVNEWKFPVTLKIIVPVTTRGAHMSRLIPEQVESGDYVETILEDLAIRIRESCGVWPTISASLIYPWKDQFVDITTTWKEGVITQEYTLRGITACPCSKEEMGIGHMQRCRLTIAIRSTELYFPVLEKMEQCFSYSLKEKLKRPEEADVIKQSQANPRFVEDVVRQAVVSFGDKLIYAEAESEESIHSHNAFARWDK